MSEVTPEVLSPHKRLARVQYMVLRLVSGLSQTVCYGVGLRRIYIYWLSVRNKTSPNIVRVIKSRRIGWAGHVARMGESRGVYRVLVGKSEAKRPLGRPRRRWEDNIKMDLQE